MSRPTRTVEPPVPLPPDTGPSDAEVIRRSRDEPEIFAVLFERHAETLHRYVARRLGPLVSERIDPSPEV